MEKTQEFTELGSRNGDTISHHKKWRRKLWVVLVGRSFSSGQIE